MSPTQICSPIKKVKITASNSSPRISVREVQAVAKGTNTNVGLQVNGAIASQSSTDGSYNATQAIDGSVLTHSSTLNETNAWLQVSFNQPQILSSITIKNCNLNNACQGYLNNAKIEYIDAQDDVKFTAFIGDLSNGLDYTAFYPACFKSPGPTKVS
jgi:hypothetical protein